LRNEVRQVVESGRSGDFEPLEKLVAGNPRAVRHLLGLSYHPDPGKRRVAGQGLAIASKYHPKLVQEVIRRLVWAMNDESGTNALTAPQVLQSIAEEKPELLLPVVPDLTRLSADPGLRDGLAAALKEVTDRCPGKVGESLTLSLRKRFRKRRKKR
jgi:hypothetical protein